MNISHEPNPFGDLVVEQPLLSTDPFPKALAKLVVSASLLNMPSDCRSDNLGHREIVHRRDGFQLLSLLG
ncbi:MAG: hypothetical protein ACLPUG_06930 [Acidimicrobiales bacterium]